ncbi:MAG: hypothetical protein JXA58_04605, partial [Dehalococcoidia bacterium]|nr:hypothetical protein [Dehalococcoidia bacterium]
CADRGVALTAVGQDVTWDVVERSLESQTVRMNGTGGGRSFRIPLIATYEAENAAVALAALDALMSRGIVLEWGCVSRGLGHAHWPGRFQVLAREPLLVLDGAHNPASMRRLAENVSLVRAAGDVVYVLGFSSDKDVRGAVAELSQTGGRCVLTHSGQPRALSPEEMAGRLSELGLQVRCEPQPWSALWRARRMVNRTGMVVVAGSLYLVGRVLGEWKRDTESQLRWTTETTVLTGASSR